MMGFLKKGAFSIQIGAFGIEWIAGGWYGLIPGNEDILTRTDRLKELTQGLTTAGFG